jgi:hypothetical protein
VRSVLSQPRLAIGAGFWRSRQQADCEPCCGGGSSKVVESIVSRKRLTAQAAREHVGGGWQREK